MSWMSAFHLHDCYLSLADKGSDRSDRWVAWTALNYQEQREQVERQKGNIVLEKHTD